MSYGWGKKVMLRIISNVAGNVAIRPYEPSRILTGDTHERQM